MAVRNVPEGFSRELATQQITTLTLVADVADKVRSQGLNRSIAKSRTSSTALPKGMFAKASIALRLALADFYHMDEEMNRWRLDREQDWLAHIHVADRSFCPRHPKSYPCTLCRMLRQVGYDGMVSGVSLNDITAEAKTGCGICVRPYGVVEFKRRPTGKQLYLVAILQHMRLDSCR